MSDIYLQTERGTPDIEIINGVPRLTSSLSTAVYLSLFIPDWWGNDGLPSEQQYTSVIPEIMSSNE